MKLLLALLCILGSSYSHSATEFIPVLDQGTGHLLQWQFSAPVKDWGKNDRRQVQLQCGAIEVPEFDLKWINAQGLQVYFKKNLPPGSRCQGQLHLAQHNDKFSFTVPLVKILESYPWSFELMDPEPVFLLVTDAPIDPELVARKAYLDVEGMNEKIEFEVVKGQVLEKLKKSVYLEKQNTVALKSRRTLPYEKKFNFIVQEGATNGYKKEGKIKEPFKLKISCERTKPSLPCSPLGTISFEFTNPVHKEDLKEIVISSKNKKLKLNFSNMGSQPNFAHVDGKLEPETEYTISLPPLKDVDGQELSNAKKFPLKITTASYPPLAKFPKSFGILESEADPALPVSVRNVEKVIHLNKTSAVISLKDPLLVMKWQKAIDARQSYGYEEDLRSQSVFSGSKLKTVQEKLSYTASKNEVEVLGLPLKQKGFHIVELSSPLIADSFGQSKFFISTGVLVTNMAAHLKLGSTNSLVWVTSLDKGEAVADAEVKLYDCKGKVLRAGKTNTKGFITFPGKIGFNCLNDSLPHLSGNVMVVAFKGNDSTFTLSDWKEGIESWRFSIPYSYAHQGDNAQRAHTVFDRPIYKQGETVHMLTLYRAQSDKDLQYSKEKFHRLLITHSLTGQEWEIVLKGGDQGRFTNEFKIPSEAPQGVYELSLISLDKSQVKHRLEAGRFSVKDFRVPLMKSSFHTQDFIESFGPQEEVKVLGQIQFLAGGSASGIPVVLRTEMHESSAYFPKYEDFSFNFGDGLPESKEEETRDPTKKETQTDKNGAFEFAVEKVSTSNRLQNILFEIEYLDPNGIFQTNSTSAKVFPAETVIGMRKPKDPFTPGKRTYLSLIFLNHRGTPRSGSTYTARLYRIDTISHRKKILGGFYTYESQKKVVNLGEVCKGKSDKSGAATCSFKMPNEAGDYSFVVEGDKAIHHERLWSYDSNYWSDQEYHDRMDLIADKKYYLPGDTAKIELKLPFEKATLLVTKERGGIYETELMNYTKEHPFIHLPLNMEDSPNTFLSVFAVRGRLAGGQPTGTIDLARPAYRLGLIQIEVQSKKSEILLTMTSDKEKYNPREKVKIKLKAQNPNGAPVVNGKVVLSVFDEGLLQIKKQNSFNVINSLIQNFFHQVQTSTAQSHIIGKRHFGLKARPAGGSGGHDIQPRELFETLVYWNPVIDLNTQGEATVEFPLNDSLTSFKIYGLAYTESKFGTANSSIVSTQDIMTFVGTSPKVRTGDQFFAQYTLKNMTSIEKSLRVELSLNGKLIREEKIKIAGGASQSFSSPITPFTQPGEVEYRLKVFVGKKMMDDIKTLQTITPLYTPRVKFADLKQIQAQLTIPGQKSDPLLAGTQIFLSADLLPSKDSLRRYMEGYLYNCLEQRFARGIILEDKSLMKEIDNELQSYFDSRLLLKFYPVPHLSGSLALSAYILEMSYWNKISFSKHKDIEYGLSQFISGRTKNLDEWEKNNFETLKIRAMAVLKLIDSKYFQAEWTKDISPPLEGDSFDTLLDKGILLPENHGIEKMVLKKMKIDGQSINLASLPQNSMGFTLPTSALFARMILLQKKMPSDFYKANEGKFLRGFLGYKHLGQFGDTMTSTYASTLVKKFPKSQITGQTEIASLKSEWKNNTSPPIYLQREVAMKDQTLTHAGNGWPWADIRYLSFPDPQEYHFQGIELSQKITNLEDRKEFKLQDRVKLELTVKVHHDVSLPGLRLPLPSGISILSSRSDDLGITFEERTEQMWTGYFIRIPKGEYKIEVVFRLNQPGVYEVPGARLEALYSPDVYGELPYWSMKIQ